ncbi:MAG TPA: peptide chain release factor N(5)-glutamine methyltransferase [Dehalococcoidales bacterium]|nr:peptide chain release factor N(5)-glutamine methyltransferase [Dehalococcoidales bacterium]
MNLREALARARHILSDGNFEDADLEGEVLLRHVLGVGRAELFVGLDLDLSPEKAAGLRQVLERRLGGEPLAYITGHREFYGLDFFVDPRVLIPRPETELLVEKALGLAGRRTINTIADIGTGCGAIAVSLAVNLPGAVIYAADVSAPALEVAAANCRKHGVADRVTLLLGDLLEPLPTPVDLIIANLPYVRETELIPGGPLRFEPEVALHGGSDGLDRIGELCRHGSERLSPGGCLLLEIGQGQSGAVTSLLRREFPSGEVAVECDLAGIERVVGLCLTPAHT